MDYITRARKVLGSTTYDKRPLSPAEVRVHNESAREVLDHFFTAAVVPALTRLYREGRLPSFADDLAWRGAEREWAAANEASLVPCDAGKVQRLMAVFIEARGGTVEAVPEAGEEGPDRAVRIRKGKHEFVVASRVLPSWEADGWREVAPKTARKVDRGEANEKRLDPQYTPKSGGTTK